MVCIKLDSLSFAMNERKILIGTKNPHKRHKLSQIVVPFFSPLSGDDIAEPEENHNSFLDIAIQKANAYSQQVDGWAISTDGGAIIPALSQEEWQPLYTKRFAATDIERINKLLSLMEGKTDRTIEWHEAIAVSYKGKIVFSATARAMDGVISRAFNPDYYQEGIWLCSITDFPSFGNRNYFELNEDEKTMTEDSWGKLRMKLHDFFTNYF